MKAQKLVNLQVFPDSAHQAEHERYHGHIKLDDKKRRTWTINS